MYSLPYFLAALKQGLAMSATLYHTSIAGSLPKPAWLSETNKLWPKWRAEGDELLDAKRDATLLWPEFVGF